MKSVLLVDDEVDTVEVLDMLLRLEGFDTLKAYDGAEGLVVAESETPDVIVTDLMMPHMDGLEMARQLRSGEATRRIPVILSSAGPRPQADDDPPYVAFLQKPVDVQALLRVLEQVLR
ncbi:MAG: response regulator [Pseudomonadota bacterium]